MISPRARRIGLILLIAAISFSPRFLLPIAIPGRRFDLRFEDFVLLILLLVWFLHLLRQQPLDLTPLSAPLAIYTLIAVISTNINLMSFDHFSLARAFLYLLKEIESFLIFLVVANWIITRDDVVLVGRTMLGAGLVNLLWVAVQLARGRKGPLFFTSGEGLPAEVFRGRTTLSSYGPGLIGEISPLSTGGFFAIALILALSCAMFSGTGKGRRVSLGLFLACFCSLLLSGSRTGMLSALAGIAVLLLPSLLRTIRRRISIALSLGMIVLALTLLAFLIHVPDIPGADLRPFSVVNARRSLVYRVERIWRSSLSVGYDRFLLGFGKGSLGSVLATTEAHNHYLRVFLETGLFGVLVFVWLLAKIAALSARLFRNSRFAISKAVGGAALAATVGFSIGALTNDVFYPVVATEFWWVLVGAAVAADRIERLSHE